MPGGSTSSRWDPRIPFRAEVLERTPHYYFMSPVRRAVLAVSKYLAGLIAAIVYFVGSVVLSFLFISAHWVRSLACW